MFSFGSSGSKGSTELATKEFAGAFGEAEGGDLRKSSRRLAEGLEALLGRGAGGISDFGPRSTAESDLLGTLTNQANQRTALRGLGPATGTDIGKAIAPLLLSLRQGEAERGLQGRGQDIQGLLELIGLASPQVVAGQRGKESSSSFGFGLN